MKAPSRIRINGRLFTTRPMPADGPHLGEMHGDTGTILIQEGQTRESLKDTLLHEVFHAIRYQQGREDGGKVERIMYAA